MSPNEWCQYSIPFKKAADKFGWKAKLIVVEHEREWSRSWGEIIWLDQNGNRLFSEDDMEENLVKELIRIATNL